VKIKEPSLLKFLHYCL